MLDHFGSAHLLVLFSFEGLLPMSQESKTAGAQYASLASFCRETPGFMRACANSPIKLGTTDDRCRVSPSGLTRFLSRFHELPRWTARGRNDLRRSLPRAKDRESQAAFRLRDDRSANRAAIFMRLLASTAAATHSSKRSRPSARQRFMPRPRNNTEMRPSMPARKR